MKIVPSTKDGRLFGYGRVSREEQSEAVQVEALTAAGVPRENIYTDHASGRTMRRVGVQTVNKALREGDVLVIMRLDRLTRSSRDMVEIIKDFRERQVSIFSLTEGVDITTPGGRMLAMMLVTLAEYEVELMSERTKAGQALGKELGFHPGRPSLTTPAQKVEIVKLMRNKPKNTLYKAWIKAVGKRYGIKPTTVVGILKNARRAVTKQRREKS